MLYQLRAISAQIRPAAILLRSMCQDCPVGRLLWDINYSSRFTSYFEVRLVRAFPYLKLWFSIASNFTVYIYGIKINITSRCQTTTISCTPLVFLQYTAVIPLQSICFSHQFVPYSSFSETFHFNITGRLWIESNTKPVMDICFPMRSLVMDQYMDGTSAVILLKHRLHSQISSSSIRLLAARCL